MASSSSSLPRWEYDVFLSFRGEDTRKGFVGHLYTALDHKGIRTFKDDEKLEKGKSLSPELVKHINASRIAVIVFSENYASSRWCLDELVEILKCSKTKGQKVLPLFYGVKASEVRKQKRTYKEAFRQHEEIHKEEMERVQKWRDALKEAANLSGFDLEEAANGYEDKFIKQIVQEISNNLPRAFKVVEYEVGIVSRVEKLIMLLNNMSEDNLFIGICGFGGIGKTTLAKAVFKKKNYEFEGSCFLENVREESKKHDGLTKLQENLLRQTLKDNNMRIWNSGRGSTEIKDRLQHKKILIVLDDVDHEKQLMALVGIGHNWFGLGSTIIITTRNERLLRDYKVKMYHSELLNDNEALELFSWHAFEQENPEEEYRELSCRIKYYAKGLPLALRVLGSFLHGRSIPEWKSVLDKLKSNPPKEIQDVLRLSYDGLDETEKSIFLDIACFFKGYDIKFATDIFQSCEFHPIIGIEVLIERSLITKSKNVIWMHDLVQEMGQKIVHQESKDPGKRTRLWSYEDIYEVLSENTGTESIEAIVLTEKGSSSGDVDLGLSPDNVDVFEGGLYVSVDVFKKMRKLRILKIRGVQLLGCLTHLSNELRYLDWKGYPGEYLPSQFRPKKLAILQLTNSPFKGIWSNTKFLEMLKVIRLAYCENLPETSLNFSGFPFLEELNLTACTSLIEVAFDNMKFPDRFKSVKLDLCTNLKNASNLFGLPGLETLSLWGCENLESLPTRINLKNLKFFSLKWCSKIEKFPEIQGDMNCLEYLCLRGTAIREIPSSVVEHFKGLRRLNLCDCKVLETLPSSIGEMKSLEVLDLKGSGLKNLPSLVEKLKRLKILNMMYCKLFERLPNNIGEMKSLTRLLLRGTSIKDLPSSVEHLKDLRRLDLTGCKLLRILPTNIGELENLQFLGLTSSGIKKLPPSIAKLTNLETLFWSNCNLDDESILNLPPSLKDLDLSCNSFVNLPASFTQLTHLLFLELNGCLNLQTLESLPLSSALKVNAQDCVLLKWHSIPNGEGISFEGQGLFTKSRKLVGNDNDESNICYYSASQLQEIGDTSILLPGSEIPSWFNMNSLWDDDSLRTFGWEIDSIKVKGIAICAVIGINHNHAPSDDEEEEPFTRWLTIELEMDGCQRSFSLSDRFNRIKSDHIAFSCIRRESFSQRVPNDWSWNFNSVSIVATMAGLRADGPFKVKRWGLKVVLDE